MIFSLDQLKQIIGAGSNLILDSSMMTLPQLKSLAEEAANQTVFITLKKIEGFTPEHLKQIAQLAPGKIVFDLTLNVSINRIESDITIQ